MVPISWQPLSLGTSKGDTSNPKWLVRVRYRVSVLDSMHDLCYNFTAPYAIDRNSSAIAMHTVFLTNWPLGNLNESLDMYFQTDFSDWLLRDLLWSGPNINMSLDFTDNQLTLVKVTAWCRQATSHYLSQCWPRSLSPYGVAKPQWVNRIHIFVL